MLLGGSPSQSTPAALPALPEGEPRGRCGLLPCAKCGMLSALLSSALRCKFSQTHCEALTPLPLPLGEVARPKAVTERASPLPETNPLSRLRRQLPRRGSPWQRGQGLRRQANGMKALTDEQKNFTPLPKARPSKDFPRPGEDVAVRRQKGVQAGNADRRWLRGFSGTHPLQPVTHLTKASGPALCAKNLAGEYSPAV